jgi:D-3-phosphoglycerate dehydrogenase
MLKILLTSASFHETPGLHHDLLNNSGHKIEVLKGPVSEEKLTPIIADYDAVICGDDDYTRRVLEIGKKGELKYILKYDVGLDKVDISAAK